MGKEGIAWAPVLQVCGHKTALLGSHRVKAGMQRQAGQNLGPEKQKSVESKAAAAEVGGQAARLQLGKPDAPRLTQSCGDLASHGFSREDTGAVCGIGQVYWDGTILTCS